MDSGSLQKPFFYVCSGGGGDLRGDRRAYPWTALRLPLYIAQHDLLRLHMESLLRSGARNILDNHSGVGQFNDD